MLHAGTSEDASRPKPPSMGQTPVNSCLPVQHTCSGLSPVVFPRQKNPPLWLLRGLLFTRKMFFRRSELQPRREDSQLIRSSRKTVPILTCSSQGLYLTELEEKKGNIWEQEAAHG